MLRFLRFALVIVALAVGMMFALFNVGSVTVDYLFGSLEISLVALLVLDLLLGLALGALIYLPRQLGLRLELERTRKKLATAEIEIRNLRNLPIKDAWAAGREPVAATGGGGNRLVSGPALRRRRPRRGGCEC